MKKTTLSGELPRRLAQGISDAIHKAVKSGMELDEACCVGVSVIADYARAAYGPGYLAPLSGVLLERGDRPPPELKRANR